MKTHWLLHSEIMVTDPNFVRQKGWVETVMSYIPIW